jgi:FtsP/CotA-like multicopper oxidase with cupredoxin domain
MSHGIRALRATAILAALAAMTALPAGAGIDGLPGSTFSLVTGIGYLDLTDGDSYYFWGFADATTGQVQYPGPTLIVNEGDMVTVQLTNPLPEPVSLIFPGLTEGPTTPTYDTNGKLRSLAPEAPAGGGTRTYSFRATRPGTYYYQSGSHLDKQVGMGLFGAIIVRSRHYRQAYNHPASAYDREFLFVLSNMDASAPAAFEQDAFWDSSSFFATTWFINGRNGMDTLLPSYSSWLPAQPYSAIPTMHPGERVLVRLVNLGRDVHPFHVHGNHLRVIARDGRMLESAPGNGDDLAQDQFTVPIGPGQTLDGIFEWTGAGLGWDIYGHRCSDPYEPHEYVPDHCKLFPTIIPPADALTLGEFYSGSQYFGATGAKPVGEPTPNQGGGYFYMWHSHTEKELTTNDIFPGGMMTMLGIEPWSVDIGTETP